MANDMDKNKSGQQDQQSGQQGQYGQGQKGEEGRLRHSGPAAQRTKQGGQEEPAQGA